MTRASNFGEIWKEWWFILGYLRISLNGVREEDTFIIPA
jgi:hypothetical protein